MARTAAVLGAVADHDVRVVVGVAHVPVRIHSNVNSSGSMIMVGRPTPAAAPRGPWTTPSFRGRRVASSRTGDHVYEDSLWGCPNTARSQTDKNALTWRCEPTRNALRYCGSHVPMKLSIPTATEVLLATKPASGRGAEARVPLRVAVALDPGVVAAATGQPCPSK